MKKLFLAAVVAGLAIAGAGAQTMKIAVFDPQRVSEESDDGKKVQTELTGLRDRKQAELSAKEKELQELQNQLTAQGLSLSADRRTALEKDIQRKLLELQQAREAARSEMQIELSSAQSRFQEKLLAIVEQFGREEGFTLVLDRSVAAYAAPGIDVTTAIVDRLNAWTRQQKPPAAPAAAPPATKGGGS
jgi:outer membrane protein